MASPSTAVREVDEPWSAFNDDFTDSNRNDPWTTDGTISASDTSSELGDSDFSQLTLDECRRLSNSNWASFDNIERSSTSPRVTKSAAFQTDHSYLNRLENKLNKLHKGSGKGEKKDMLRQVRDRANGLFGVDSERVDSSDGEQIINNPLTLRLFPQQPISAEEKLLLVKNEQILVAPSDEIAGEMTRGDQMKQTNPG